MSEKEVQNKKNVWSKIPKLIRKILVIVIILVSAIFFFSSGVVFSSKLTSKMKTTELGLKDVGELVTQTCFTTVLKDNQTDRSFFKLFKIPFTKSRQIFSYDYEVDAGVDFSKISYTVDIKKKEINIRIPHAKVYKTTQKTDSLKVYLDDESLFSRIDLEDSKEAQTKMQDQATSDCVKNRLLDAADTNAKTLIEGLVKGNNDYGKYKIIFQYK